jgi:2-oxoglutarate ferredoxin oxidoreductase subunit alpha
MTEPRLMEGSEAIAQAMLAAGCRFFAGYPMTPFTEVLEHMGRGLPTAGGVCMNAESELEAIGMAWGAAATGARAATGSTGQGLALMQESISEMATAGVPVVILNMGRAQADYFQATRGGGHGDYRTIALAPADVVEAVDLVGQAFELADRWRIPVLVYGDYFLAHTWQTVQIPEPTTHEAADTKPWALDGSTGGGGRAKLLSPLGQAKQRDGVGYDLAEHLQRAAARVADVEAGVTPMMEREFTDDADLVVAAFGSLGAFARHVIRELRDEGHRVGLVRPITLWPFPSAQLRDAVSTAGRVVVWENNQGQMLDDVRLAVGDGAQVDFIGGLSMDSSGFGVGPDITAVELKRRVLAALGHEVPA